MPVLPNEPPVGVGWLIRQTLVHYSCQSSDRSASSYVHHLPLPVKRSTYNDALNYLCIQYHVQGVGSIALLEEIRLKCQHAFISRFVR
jgi:hypothetical protein